VASSFDQDFAGFAEKLARGKAETYLIRTLQYAAHHGALTGIIDVDRKHFGTLVLSRAWDVVSTREGGKVYDALISVGLAAEDGSRADLDAHLERYQETTPKDDPESLSRARSLPVPSRPDPGQGKEGKEGSPTAGSASAVQGPQPPRLVDVKRTRDTLDKLDSILGRGLAEPEPVLRAQARVKLGRFEDADEIIAAHGNGADA
jgi:hypothetical protein